MYATATLLPNGKVLIAGGIGSGGTDVSGTDIYDPITNTFAASTPSMNEARDSSTATLLPNGTVLIAGGRIVPLFAPITAVPLSSTEVYSP